MCGLLSSLRVVYLCRELKYVIQRFAEDPRQEVSLLYYYNNTPINHNIKTTDR